MCKHPLSFFFEITSSCDAVLCQLDKLGGLIKVGRGVVKVAKCLGLFLCLHKSEVVFLKMKLKGEKEDEREGNERNKGKTFL